jgi:prepilin signal peptidase PulO-like enzyme (type II secretory pathway)
MPATFFFQMFIFLFGIGMGGASNWLADRFMDGERTLLKKRACSVCKAELQWHDMIPVLSFLLLKGSEAGEAIRRQMR